MTLTTRLQKVTRGLTPLQRAILVVRAVREGREPDPDLRRIEDDSQRRAFNRYMAYLWVVNYQLASAINVVYFRVEAAEKEVVRFQTLSLAGDEADRIEGREQRSRGIRRWRQQTENIGLPEFLRSLALECRYDGRQQVLHLWQEVLGLERILDEVAEAFEGEEILLPEYREQLDKTTERLQQAAEVLAIRKLPIEPGEEFVRMWSEQIDQAFARLGLVELS